MGIRRRILLLPALLLGGLAQAQAQPQAPAERPDIPWPVMMGARVAAAEANRPIAPLVVLVPDADTYLREVGRWSPTAQWPVLIEDDVLAPCFIRAYRPQRIIRVPAAEPFTGDARDREDALRAVVAASWGAKDDESAEAVFARLNWSPPGIAITSVEDPAWPAAVAIAAARGLPLGFLDGDFGAPNGVLDTAQTRGLMERIEEIASRSGYRWKGQGDAIDAIAICRSLAARTSLEPPKNQRHPAAAQLPGPYALTDMIGRNADGYRWAFAGWIWGDHARSAYMAMCSIFLARDSTWFFNGYDPNGGREAYQVGQATELARGLGFQTIVYEGKAADEAAWLRLLMGGFLADVLFMNSSGMPDYMDLGAGTRGHPGDVPILQKPLALHLIHSFSLKFPESMQSIGGRFLDRGVYAYVGSVNEPYLMAFQPPELVVKRLSAFTPFLVASQPWQGPVSRPWRLASIGDPLMLVQPPVRRTRPVSALPEVPEAEDLVVAAQEILKGFKDDPTTGAQAIQSLVLIGRDDVAAKVWEALQGEDNLANQAAAAPAAMEPLFRTRSFDAFIDAYERLPEANRRGEVLDMLWHLATPRLGALQDPNVLALLARSPRSPKPEVDLRRVRPHLDRVLGDGAGRAAIQSALDTARTDSSRKALRDLLSG